jgi:signal transduction histidine kinase
VRRRLVLAISAVAAVSIALFALPLAIVLQRNYRDRELLRLQRDTVAAAREIDVGTNADDPVELPLGGDRFAIYDRVGRRVAGRSGDGPATGDGVVRDVLRNRRPSVRTPPETLVAAVPLLTGEEVSGVIRAQRPDAVVADATRDAWLQLAAAAVALMALAAGAALLLGRRIAAPLERVAHAATRLGDGDFTVRAPRGAVAEIDAVADALDTTAARLGDLIARERAFSADASHQLRTPLAALRIELEAMQLDETAPAGVGAAVGQVDRLQQTIQTLLSAARDVPRPHDRTADVAAILGDAEARWNPLLRRDGRELRIVADAAGDVRATPEIVREILDVVIDNAHRHGAGPVTITLRDLGNWRAIDVQDAGEGPQTPDATFDGRKPGSDGHGIGLTLARSLAQAEGGQLTLSHPGPHPIFTLLLPSQPTPAR